MLASPGLAGADGYCSTWAFLSPQLTMRSEVFPITKDAPLDMRMDRRRPGCVRRGKRLKRNFVISCSNTAKNASAADSSGRHRAGERKKPIETTGEFVKIIKGVTPAKAVRENPASGQAQLSGDPHSR